MQIIVRPQAEAGLDDIFSYLVERNPDAAFRVLDTIWSHLRRLGSQPNLGRPGRAGGRELVIPRTPYIAPYTVDLSRSAVVILRMLHGVRNWPTEFNGAA